jgi:hypothetical protein
MLSFAEEILLLSLDDKTGRFLALPDRSMDFALAGALICELTFKGIVDADPEFLYLKEKKETGDELFDRVISKFPEEGKAPLNEFLAQLASGGRCIKDKVLEMLIEKKVLKLLDDKIFWVFHVRRYPIINDQEEIEIKQRIRDVVLRKEHAQKKDIVLISLIRTCRLFPTLLTEEELLQSQERIEEIISRNCIGTAMCSAIEQIQRAITEIRAYSGM